MGLRSSVKTWRHHITDPRRLCSSMYLAGRQVLCEISSWEAGSSASSTRALAYPSPCMMSLGSSNPLETTFQVSDKRWARVSLFRASWSLQGPLQLELLAHAFFSVLGSNTSPLPGPHPNFGNYCFIFYLYIFDIFPFRFRTLM